MQGLGVQSTSGRLLVAASQALRPVSRKTASTGRSPRRSPVRACATRALEGSAAAQQGTVADTAPQIEPAASPAAPPSQLEAEAEYDVDVRLRLQIGTANIPHPDKATYGGEDAFFVSDVGGGAFGVADGVGGWADSEINPAEYAKTFMLVAKYYLEGRDVRMNDVNGSVTLVSANTPLDTFDGDRERTPQGALDAGHVATRLPGSTTACVVRLNREERTISAANLGDSGFVIVRDGYITFRSPVLQHFFDCPLQFGAVPEHTNASDYAEDADLFDLKVHPGDIIIAASDGLWDNARDEEVLKTLNPVTEDTDQAAQLLARLAERNSADETYESPYTVEALRQGIDLGWFDKLRKTTFSPRDGGFKLGKLQGGKLDDITVLVARVVEEEVRIPRAPLELQAGEPQSDAATQPEATA